MQKILLYQPAIVNEGVIHVDNVLIEDGIISRIGGALPTGAVQIIDCKGMYLFPGVIDTHVHFRQPGLTHKGEIYTESAAAVAGGVTSFFDMPNTMPNAVTLNILEDKYRLARENSFANYSFYIGATASNTKELRAADYTQICGITDDGLYFTNQRSLLIEQPDLLKELLAGFDEIIAIHSEYESVIEQNLADAIIKYGEHIDVSLHPEIRSEQACFDATAEAIRIAREAGGRLHVLHLSTAKEAALFDAGLPVNQKNITAEVCVHHLWFSEEDYKRLGAKIKWNPAIKTAKDKEGLLAALIDGHIDVVSTDHAPHLLEEKQRSYTASPGGAPMVQHSLIVMLELVKQGKVTIEMVVDKMSHNPARLFRIANRGFIREGYYADLVIVDMNKPWVVDKSNIRYKCEWSPLEGQLFHSKVYATIVNGQIAYLNDTLCRKPNGQRLSFGKA